MNPRIKSAQALSGHRLDVEFVNGERRIFDASPYLDVGVFRALRDPAIFAGVVVVNGAIQWPGEIDLSWDTVYLRSAA
ncbi:DUF2442 domain-containing protein [Panacagrimonas sp.]|uniref:DUF2442 domain-containing protein n=1 Tax=Panacagrimonas sp. TaxID=2480088 RepID=UPI003B522F23